MSTLSLRNISKHFKQTGAVQDVSLDIRSGEFFSILGPSGCGKTTLLRIVAGFEPPTTGAVLLDDRDITATVPQHRGIGMVFQNYALFPHMTVLGNVAFGLEAKKVPKGEIRQRVESILDAVHLKEKIDQPVPHLSGGEQQRVAVARALVVEPSVLLLDEPLSNLDVTLRLSTREEIRALQRRTGITTLYVTHDQSEAMTLSDRIAVMQNGRVVQVGSPAEVYERPLNVFVAEFLGGANIVQGTLDEQSGMFVCDAFHLRVPPHRAAGFGAVAVAIKPEAVGLQPDPGTEDLLGRIIEKEYLGFATAFLIDVGGFKLKAIMVSSEMSHGLSVQQGVSMRLDWSKINLLSEAL